MYTNYTGSKDNLHFINLNVLNQYRQKFQESSWGFLIIHGHASVLGAIALGAKAVEKHFTDDNSRVGPDHSFAMNPVTWKIW